VRPGDAGCRLACCSAATVMAGYGLTRPCDCGRWLPARLPGIWLATLTFECLYLLHDAMPKPKYPEMVAETRYPPGNPGGMTNPRLHFYYYFQL
jgi:hypothetical protein